MNELSPDSGHITVPGLEYSPRALTLEMTDDLARGTEYARRLRESLGLLRMDIDIAEHHRRVDYMFSLGLYSAVHLGDSCLGERIAVCGSGPSLAASLPYLREFKGKIMALNGAHDYLLANGIKPTFGVLLDPREWVVSYQTPTPGVIYLIGSSVHPKVWQRFLENGIKPWPFIPIMTDIEHEELSEKYADQALYVAGATTVGLRSLNILMHLGASVAESHGFDSCYAPGNNGLIGKEMHAHAKPYVDHDARVATVKSVLGDRFKFITNGPMARQIIGFNSFVQNLPFHGVHDRYGKFRLVVAGDGAIPWMAWKDGGADKHIEHLNPGAMAAKYGNATHWDYYANQEIVMKDAA